MLRRSLDAAVATTRRRCVRAHAPSACWPRRCLHATVAPRAVTVPRPDESGPQRRLQRRNSGRQSPPQHRRTPPPLPQPEALPALLNDLEAWAVTAPAGCTVTSGKVARALSSVRAGERTAYLQRAAELGHANPGVALEFLRANWAEAGSISRLNLVAESCASMLQADAIAAVARAVGVDGSAAVAAARVNAAWRDANAQVMCDWLRTEAAGL